MNCNEITAHVMNCAECKRTIQAIFSQRAGSVSSVKKSNAAKLNGMKGGRPKK